MALDPISWFFIYFALYVSAMYIADKLTKNKIESPKPGQINFPEIREGKEYSVVFGTCWISDPVPVWWGHIKTTPIRKKVGEKIDWWWGLPGHGSPTNSVYQTVGYHYYAGMHLKLCHGPIDGIKQIRIGDKVAWPNPDDETELQADGATAITINQPNLFGGEDREGGIVGSLDVQYGHSTQSQNSYLVSQLGSDISASRGLVGIIIKQVNLGTSPYIKPCKFLGKRTSILSDGSAQWYSSKADIGGDMNAIHLLRECYTNTHWGLRHPTNLIDDGCWRTAANICYNEGFGLSRRWDESFESLENFIEEIKRHIDCVIYQDMQTNKFMIKLIRDDYDIEELEEFDQNDIVEVNNFTRPSYGKIPTTVIVNYWDIIRDDTAGVPDDDIATLQIQGGKSITKEIDYFGITKIDLAGKVVARDRQQITSMLACFVVKGKRTMSHLRPGDVFKLTWPIMGIANMVVRILSAKYGKLYPGSVEFSCTEDVFSTENANYSPPPTTGWTDPRSEPAEVPYYLLIETPFWTIVKQIGIANAEELDNDSGFLTVGGSQPSGDSLDYELLVRDGLTEDFYSDGRGNFTPTGTLDAGLPLNAVDATVDLSNTEGLVSVNVGDFAVIGNEIVKVLSVNAATNQIQIARGVLDTVPVAHSADDRIWFIESINFLVGATYTVADQPGVKFLPKTPKGQLEEGDATARNADVFNRRMVRPYPPGDFKINAVSYPTNFSGQPTVTWAHRDRTEHDGVIVEHDNESIGPETGTTYTLKIYDEDNVLVRTETGLTGTSYEYTEENERSDCSLGPEDPLNVRLRFVLYSVRDTYDSWQSYDFTVPRTVTPAAASAVASKVDPTVIIS